MTEDVVRARRFELVDQQDQLRAILTTEDGLPGLYFRDASGTTRVRVSVMPDSVGLILSDNTDMVNIGLIVSDDSEVGFTARDRGQLRVMGALQPGGNITLALWDTEGNLTHDLTQEQ